MSTIKDAPARRTLDGRADAVTFVRRLVPSRSAWLALYSFTYHGELFEYVIKGIVPATATENEAAAAAVARHAARKVTTAFLRDVKLNMELPN